MTREEKVRGLYNLKEYLVENPIELDGHKSLPITLIDYAIETLEQEPCEDVISRDELLKAIDTWDKFGCDVNTKLVPYQDHYIPYIHYDDVIKCIKNMPPVTPKPKMGHWIGHREHCENLGVMPSGLGAYEWCSNCDCGIDVREWHRNNYNYCPNCGAKMTESEEADG